MESQVSVGSTLPLTKKMRVIADSKTRRIKNTSYAS